MGKEESGENKNVKEWMTEAGKKILEASDVEVKLEGDDLTIKIEFFKVKIWEKTFDILKDGISV